MRPLVHRLIDLVGRVDVHLTRAVDTRGRHLLGLDAPSAGSRGPVGPGRAPSRS